jgi:hypothetical protein
LISPAPSSTAGRGATAWHVGGWLLCFYADIPLTVRGVGVDGDNAGLVGELVEVGDPLHVVGILVATVEEDDYGIVLFVIVAAGQMQYESAFDVVDLNFFLRLLSLHGSYE